MRLAKKVCESSRQRCIPNREHFPPGYAPPVGIRGCSRSRNLQKQKQPRGLPHWFHAIKKRFAPVAGSLRAQLGSNRPGAGMPGALCPLPVRAPCLVWGRQTASQSSQADHREGRGRLVAAIRSFCSLLAPKASFTAAAEAALPWRIQRQANGLTGFHLRRIAQPRIETLDFVDCFAVTHTKIVRAQLVQTFSS